jgi:ribosomal protein S18 acetylase RimI-like enzyme
MDALTIRQATADDAEAIADLIALNEPENLVSEISRDDRRDRFHDGLSSGGIASLVAEANGRLVGELTIALRHPDPSEIGFGVHPQWRRRGVASALVEHAVEYARGRGMHKLTAQVLAHNVAAVGMLQQHGFVEEGYLVNQFARRSGGASDAVLLARSLA